MFGLKQKILALFYLAAFSPLAIFTETAAGPTQAERLTMILEDPALASALALSKGIVVVPRVTQGSLLMLQGAVGNGAVIMRDEGSGLWCAPAAVRFLSGGFEGRSIGVGRKGPVILSVQSGFVAKQLWARLDLVSDTVRMDDMPGGDAEADILYLGPDPIRGFVINSGSSFLDDLFGSAEIETPCSYYALADVMKLLD
ncbi:hypothetical protein [Aestuariispira insulae]|uniref:Lipid-binding SYLF domain-containing protein n=1 Tax=Aestuariispira insulae TaxID=1461337 RepID=A0A3D9HSQ0_9PROT|nr:hypothetical protein [Aestuariispira insulae]RED52533.1 hypothetical protein DFP90_102556 [Aestuariispira insulae]